jgi:hypothetical protein
MNWVRENWDLILEVLGFLALVVASVITRLGPEKAPKWLLVVADVLSFVPKKDKKGLLGPVNVPGVPSLEKKNDQA